MSVNKFTLPPKFDELVSKINEIIDNLGGTITNYVTTDTAQNITGTKTFVGQKKIAFKQSGSSDKLGFTLYNNSGTEKGYLEYNPSNTVDSVPLMTLGNYASSAAGLTHVGFRKYSSVSGASGAYNLLAPLISDAKTPFNLTTTYTNFYLPLGFTNGTNTVLTAKTGVVDLSSLLPTVPTNISAFTNDSGYITSSALSGYATETWVGQQGYITSSALSGYATEMWVGNQGYAVASSLATVATSGSYADLLNKPTIPTVNNATLTIQKNGTTVNTFTANASTDVTANITVPTDLGDLTNNAGYTKNVGTVTSVNNVSPVNGNVTLSIPSEGANKDLSNLSSTGETHFQSPLVSGTNIKTINNTSILGSGNISTLQGTTYYVDYAHTTYAEITEALTQYRIIVCHYFIDKEYYILSKKDTNYYYFSCCHGNGKMSQITVSSSTNLWSPPTTVDLVTSISSSSTDTQYPSAKCVYDKLTDKADTDLSNLSSTGQKVIDGQFVPKHNVISCTTSVGSYSASISSYFPDDGAYEVLIDAYVGYSSANSRFYIGTMASPADNEQSGSGFVVSTLVVSNSRTQKICCWFPIGTSRTIYYQNTTGANKDTNITFRGYRRIGTNS